jgi:hypothetical protein
MRNAMRLVHAALVACACTIFAVPGGAAVAADSPHDGGEHLAASYGAGSRDAPVAGVRAPLSYTDEFDRAELVEEMLKECRGIPYNAYELTITSGEKLSRPAPIQLLVIRVRHPYCATLLKDYAPKIWS